MPTARRGAQVQLMLALFVLAGAFLLALCGRRRGGPDGAAPANRARAAPLGPFCYPDNFVEIQWFGEATSAGSARWLPASTCARNVDAASGRAGGAIAYYRRHDLDAYMEFLQDALRALPVDHALRKHGARLLLNSNDGHRERIPPRPPLSQSLVPIAAAPNAHCGQQEMRLASEAREDTAPAFPLPLFAFCKHANDPSVHLLPDPYVARDRGLDALQRGTGTGANAGTGASSGIVLLPFEQRRPRLVWRGGVHGSARERMLAERAEWDPQHTEELDIRSVSVHEPHCAHRLSLQAMCDYQFQLDVDGEVSAWDALRWKLWSGSLVFKLRSHWTQWYYARLVDRTHCVFLNSLNELPFLFRYYRARPAQAAAIGARGRAFALREFSYEACVREAARALAHALEPWTRDERRVSMRQMGRLGRFGNQLFQYLFLRLYAHVHHLHVVGTGSWCGQQLFNETPPPCVTDACEDGALPAVQEESQPGFEASTRRLDESADPCLHSPAFAGKDLQGYFQVHTSHLARALGEHRAQLLQRWFELQPRWRGCFETLQTLLQQRYAHVCAVHVRRGDYGPPPFHVAPLVWYAHWLRAHLAERAPLPGLVLVYVCGDEDTEGAAAELRQALQPHVQRAEVEVLAASQFGARAGWSHALPDELAFYADFHVLRAADAAAVSNSTFGVAACLLSLPARTGPQARQKTFARPDFAARSLKPFDPWDTAPFELYARGAVQ